MCRPVVAPRDSDQLAGKSGDGGETPRVAGSSGPKPGIAPGASGYAGSMEPAQTAERAHAELRDTDGYVIESPNGDVGLVEEVWLNGEGPCALAVRLEDGRRALLLDRDVLTIDREHHWVVVPEDTRLLELDMPRLAALDGELAALWATTGEVVTTAPPPRPRARRRVLRRAAPAVVVERPLWQVVAILYAALLVIVAFVIALAFTVALLV